MNEISLYQKDKLFLHQGLIGQTFFCPEDQRDKYFCTEDLQNKLFCMSQTKKDKTFLYHRPKGQK